MVMVVAAAVLPMIGRPAIRRGDGVFALTLGPGEAMNEPLNWNSHGRE